MKKYILPLVFGLTSLNLSAQTLDEQFNELKDNSNTFKVYKVIKEAELNSFWNTVQDSVKIKEQKLTEANQRIDTQDQELASLKNVITEKDSELSEKEYAGSHITVMGIDLLKDTYIVINVVVISILLIAMGLLIFKFKDNNRIAKKKSNDYERLDNEFENYKRNALEKQMKLRRDLQTAKNRLEEIRST